MPSKRRSTPQTRELGKRIKSARTEAGMTQQKLAEETGMDRAYLVNAEGGWVNVSFLNLCRLAAALGVDTGSLVTGIERTIRDPRSLIEPG